MSHVFLLYTCALMNTNIHIGKLIRKKLEDDGHSVVWFADKMSCHRTNIYKIFKKPHIHPQQLGNASKVLNYDFFAHYLDSSAEHTKM